MKQIIVLAILLATSACATGVPAAAAGMWACSDAGAAVRFWLKVGSANTSGIRITPEVLSQIAHADGCGKRVTSLALRPVNGPDGLAIYNRDQKVGFAEPEYFYIYLSDPRVRALRERK